MKDETIKILKNTIIQWEKEYDILDSIIDMKDTRIKELKTENKKLYEEKDCLHKIIDRLLENAGYSKDIASAEDFEDVYENMQYKNNKLEEYKQTLQEIKEIADTSSPFIDNFEIKSATEVGYDYAATCNELEKRLHKVLELITKAEEE